eukprot:1515532-Pyramimonas_sp.AAC.1
MEHTPIGLVVWQLDYTEDPSRLRVGVDAPLSQRKTGHDPIQLVLPTTRLRLRSGAASTRSLSCHGEGGPASHESASSE